MTLANDMANDNPDITLRDATAALARARQAAAAAARAADLTRAASSADDAMEAADASFIFARAATEAKQIVDAIFAESPQGALGVVARDADTVANAATASADESRRLAELAARGG